MLHCSSRDLIMVDQVLKKIGYNDYDLRYLTHHRPELAESHDKFFKVIDKIKDPENQEWLLKMVSSICSMLRNMILLFL